MFFNFNRKASSSHVFSCSRWTMISTLTLEIYDKHYNILRQKYDWFSKIWVTSISQFDGFTTLQYDIFLSMFWTFCTFFVTLYIFSWWPSLIICQAQSSFEHEIFVFRSRQKSPSSPPQMREPFMAVMMTGNQRCDCFFQTFCPSFFVIVYWFWRK